MIRAAGTHSRRDPVFSGQRLGMIVSRFPKLTETFVIAEILELRRLGVEIELFPLLHEREAVIQPEVETLVDAAHYRPYSSARLWLDNLHYLLDRPARYLAALAQVVRASWRSRNFLAGAILYFPKAVSFARVIERTGVHHVHAQFANHPATVAMVIRRLTGVRFSFTARGSDIHVDRTMLPEKVAAAQFAVAVSESNKEVMVRACGADSANKIHVVYGGIDTAMFSPATAAAGESTLRIVCVGRFEEVKGQAQLIEACGVLAWRGVPFTCELIGDGELRPQLERQVERLGLKGRVLMPGSRPQREIVQTVRSASVCVLATVQAASGKREGIPNVLKEAMACAVPVVSSRISGIPELVEDGVSGILVPPAEPEALAEALIRLAADPALRRRMGQAGRARIEAHFDLRSSARQRAELFFGASSATGQAGRRAVRTGLPALRRERTEA